MYFQEASTLGDILQRQVAKYGDDSGNYLDYLICKKFLILGLLLIGILNIFFPGTKCFGSKAKAQTKFDKYLAGLGQVLAQ